MKTTILARAARSLSVSLSDVWCLGIQECRGAGDDVRRRRVRCHRRRRSRRRWALVKSGRLARAKFLSRCLSLLPRSLVLRLAWLVQSGIGRMPCGDIECRTGNGPHCSPVQPILPIFHFLCDILCPHTLQHCPRIFPSWKNFGKEGSTPPRTTTRTQRSRSFSAENCN